MENKLSIVIPYRDREEHLKQFVPHMHKYLSKEGINYHMFLIEQEEGKQFNRGMLKNIGFDISKEISTHICFHDIDMIPRGGSYKIEDGATLLAYYIEQFGFKLPYPEFFGGVIMLDNNLFIQSNGYSNRYWGWGAEDDDLKMRVLENTPEIKQRQNKYSSLPHSRINQMEESIINVERLKWAKDRIKEDGLSNLSYEIVLREDKENFSHIKVKI